MHNQLSPVQKWQIALYLLGLFTPLLFYANLPASAILSWAGLVKILPFTTILILTNLGLYYIGITLSDWCQRQLYRLLGKDYLMELSLKSFLLTVLVSTILSILFIQALEMVFGLITWIVHHVWPVLMPKSHKSPVPPEAAVYIQRGHTVFSFIIMLSAFYLTINLRAFQRLKDVQLKAERLEKESLLSQYEALKNQLSPHFLFNSLSILTSLIHEDINLSEQFIKRLSKVYRYILEQRNQDVVLLKTELDFIRAYTFLLLIRFENKFEVNIEVPESSQQQAVIAPLTLQLLVENAVKHNRMSLQEQLQIRIYTQGEWLFVENPIQARDESDPSTGVGLQNITNRYALLTDRPVNYGQEDGRFVVKIPLITPERATN